jgi:hypothetical protein
LSFYKALAFFIATIAMISASPVANNLSPAKPAAPLTPAAGSNVSQSAQICGNGQITSCCIWGSDDSIFVLNCIGLIPDVAGDSACAGNNNQVACCEQGDQIVSLQPRMKILPRKSLANA